MSTETKHEEYVHPEPSRDLPAGSDGWGDRLHIEREQHNAGGHTDHPSYDAAIYTTRIGASSSKGYVARVYDAYWPEPNCGAKYARLFRAAPELLAALELIYANAAESPEWIRDRIGPVIAKATK